MKLFKLFSFINVLMIKFSLGMNGLRTVTIEKFSYFSNFVKKI